MSGLARIDPNAPGLLSVERARAWLAQAVSVDEVKDLRDKAEAIARYQRKRKAGKESALDADTVVALADYRIGELTRELPKAPGTRGQLRGRTTSGRAKVAPPEDPTKHAPLYYDRKKADALAALGISRREAARCEAAAAIPARDFDRAIERERAKGKRITTRRLVEPIRRAQRDAELVQQAQPLKPMALARCNVLLADPPWRYEHCEDEDGRAIEKQYPTMSLAAIEAMPVGRLCTDDAVLFLWATSPKLAEAMRVLEAWGFTYRTCMVWVKDKIGMGYYARQRHELLLIGTRGKAPTPAPADRPDSVIEAPRTKHSAKPPIVHELIERMYPRLKRGELFAREKREGWLCWGNEVPS